MDSPAQILYEDNHILVVNKKSGQIIQGDKTGDIPLSELLKAYMAWKYQKPGNVFMGVVHRLDRPVSGVVCFAKTSKALSRLNESFRDRDAEKTYWAVVRGCPPEESGLLVHYLVKTESNNTSRAYIKPVDKGLKSELAYQLLEKGKTCSLLEVSPKTGRHHQIRVQLASMHCPIVGDVKYGDKRGNEDRSICLHARKLRILHPTLKEWMEWTAPVPDSRYWNVFNSVNE